MDDEELERLKKHNNLQILSNDCVEEMLRLFVDKTDTLEGIETICNTRQKLTKRLVSLKTDSELIESYSLLINCKSFDFDKTLLPSYLLDMYKRKEALRYSIQQEYVILIKELVKRKMIDKPKHMPSGKLI